MQGNDYLIGSKEVDPRPISKWMWKEPWIIGLILIIMFSIYEGSKIVSEYSTPITVYSSYAIQSGFLDIKSVLSSIALIFFCCSICIFIFIISSGMERKMLVLLSLFYTVVLVSAFLIVLIRFMVDSVLISCVNPEEAWYVRYYVDYTTLFIEYKVLPELIMCVIFMIGVVLSSLTIFGHLRLTGEAMKMMEDDSMETREYFIDVNGVNTKVYCKVKDDMRACRL